MEDLALAKSLYCDSLYALKTKLLEIERKALERRPVPTVKVDLVQSWYARFCVLVMCFLTTIRRNLRNCKSIRSLDWMLLYAVFGSSCVTL